MAVVDRVGIEVEVLGYEGAIKKMESLERAMRGLNGRKAVVQAQARLKELNKNLHGLKAQKVKLTADTTDIDRKIRRVSQNIRVLENKKAKLRLDGKDTEKVSKELIRLREQLAYLKGERINIQTNLAKVTQEMRETEAEAGRLKTALSNVKSMSIGQFFNKTASMTAHLGAAMQSAGNALTKLTNPFNTIMRGSLFAGGFAVLNMARRGLARASERADIMSTYVPIMRALGEDGTKAKAVIEKLNDAVIGLPTGLDEIVEQHKLLTMALGDMTKAQDLAIASNNAWVASGADEARVTMAKKELQTLAQTGKLNERQWMTLQKGMSVTWGEIQKKMKETGKIEGSLLEGLKDGSVSAEEFMKALTWEGIHGKTADVMNEIKHTFSAATSNIENAFARMGQNVILALDQVLKSATGKDTVDTLISLTKFIDKMSAGLQNWIKANPDTILNFLNALKDFDWKGLGQGLLEGIKFMFEFGTYAAKVLGGDGKILNPRNIGRFMIFGNLLGKSLTIVGGLLKGFRFPIAGAAASGLLLFRLFAGGGLFSKLGKLFGKFGGLGKGAKTTETALATTATSMGGIKGSIASIGRSLAGIATVAGGILIMGGTVFAVVKMIKSIVKDLGEISDDISLVDPKAMASLGKWMTAIGASFATLGTIAGSSPMSMAIAGQIEAGLLAVGAIITTISGFAWLNTKLIAGTLKNVVDAIDSVYDIAEGINKIGAMDVNMSGAESILEDIGEILPKLEPMYMGQYRMQKLSKRKAKKMADLWGSIGDIFTSIASVAGSLEAINKMPDVKGLGDKITPLTDGIGEIFDSMNEGFRGKVTPGIAKDFSDTLKPVVGMFDSIKQIATKLPEVQAELGRYLLSGRDTSPFVALKSSLTTFFKGLGDIYLSMKQDFMAAGGELSGTNTQLYATSMANVLAMFDNLSQIMTILPTLQSKLSKFIGTPTLGGGVGGGFGQGGESPMTKLTQQIKSIFKGLGEITQSLNTEIPDTSGMVDKMTALVTSVDKIGEAASKLNSLGTGALATTEGGAFTAISNIKSLISQLASAISIDAVTQIQTAVGNFRMAVDGLLLEIQQIGAEPVVIEITFDAKVKYQKVLSKLFAARQAILSAVAAACKPINRTIVINIRRSVSVSGDAIPSNASLGGGGGSWGGESTGGYIYRAKGGILPIPRKRGTDTVPTMLTPGEFVHRREAVNTFGLDFMRKVNSLDIAGAMRALSARAGANSAFARNTTINNVTNNNNRVTQNINTNNPNFAFKRSNRYIGALV